MTDITMCSGEGCEIKEKCYRFTAPKDRHMQSYFVTPPHDGDSCQHYWCNDGHRKGDHVHVDNNRLPKSTT